MKILVVVLLLLTVAVAGCSNGAIDHFKAGNQLADDGRWEEAISSCRAVHLEWQYPRSGSAREQFSCPRRSGTLAVTCAA